MHYHLEIIMPPVPGVEMPTIEHIKACVAMVMAPYNEDPETPAEDADRDAWIEWAYERKQGFWDWYVIGGRFAGNKMLAGLDQSRLEVFENWCQEEKLTVSGLIAGKQELSPADQIPKVDAKWGEIFPEFEGQPCPLFRHSNDQYDRAGDGQLPDDVIHFRDLPRNTRCSMVMIVGPDYKGEVMEARWMITDTAWNGCNHMPVKWDGTVGDALNQYMENHKHAQDEWREKYVPTDNWLAVTVDYHS